MTLTSVHDISNKYKTKINVLLPMHFFTECWLWRHDIRCAPNYVLVEEDVPGQCCPNRTCVPVTCEVDGVTYKVGESIPDDDPCTSW